MWIAYLLCLIFITVFARGRQRSLVLMKMNQLTSCEPLSLISPSHTNLLYKMISSFQAYLLKLSMPFQSLSFAILAMPVSSLLILNTLVLFSEQLKVDVPYMWSPPVFCFVHSPWFKHSCFQTCFTWNLIRCWQHCKNTTALILKGN